MEKKKYKAPQVELILIDNEITLILQSTPPAGPDEIGQNASGHFNNDPFKTDIG